MAGGAAPDAETTRCRFFRSWFAVHRLLQRGLSPNAQEAVEERFGAMTSAAEPSDSEAAGPVSTLLRGLEAGGDATRALPLVTCW